MSKPLTYPSLTSVLEYMEANKRIYMSTRTPALRKFEKSVPLRVDQLNLGHSSITLNNTSYQLRSFKSPINPKNKVEDSKSFVPGKTDGIPNALDQFGSVDHSADSALLCGDIKMKKLKEDEVFVENDNPETCITHIFLIFTVNSKRILCRRLPNHFKFHISLKQMAEFLLGKRRDIRVNRLKAYTLSGEILRLPPKLKFQIQELEIDPDQVEFLIPILDERFPLKQLIIQWYSVDDTFFDLPIVQNCEKLKIYTNKAVPFLWLHTLQNLPHREVSLVCNSLATQEMTVFVQNLLQSGSEIGKCYTFENVPWSMILDMLEIFGKQWNRRIKKSWNNLGCALTYSISYSITLPINSTSELHISGVGTLYGSNTRMEIVPITPVEPTFYESFTDFILNTCSRLFESMGI